MALLANDIYVGSVSTPTYHFTNNSLTLGGATGMFAVDVIGNELSIDTFAFTVRHIYDADMVYAPIGKSGYLDTNGKIYLLKKSGTAQYYNFVPSRSDKLVEANDKIFRVFAGYASDQFLMSLPFGTPVYWYVKGSFFRKGYLNTVERIGKYAWKATCISGIGLLDTKNHAGGIYSGTPLLTIARDIIGGAFPFVCDTEVGNTLVYGHLPYDTARNNLHRLLFASGAAMFRGSANTDYTIKNFTDVETAVPDSRISLGGSVTYQTPATRAEITEHAYYILPSDAEETLYDNTQGQAASNLLVVFSEPMHDLNTTDSLTVIDSGVNYAVVSGVGVLTGKKYTHNESKVILNRGGNDVPNIKSVKDNHLISFANSNYVAQRVLEYYSSAKRLKAKIMLKSEKVGDNISLNNAFDEPSTAYIEKMNVNVSTVIGADCELIEGFTPTGAGNNFTHRVVITANGSWTVPTGTELIRIVLIGGGQGGAGGFDGEAGAWNGDKWRWDGESEWHDGDGSAWPNQRGNGDMTTAENEIGYHASTNFYEIGVGYANGEQREPQGGASGAPGAPGKYIIYDRQVQGGDSITINIGAGGAGGARNGVAGADGGATTAQSSRFGTLTSADGVSSDTGYYDVLEQESFALPGVDGYRGGNGGLTDTNSTYGTGGYNGRAGGAVAGFSGGAGGKGKRTSITVNYYDLDGELVTGTFLQKTSGGGGGGSAYGTNGSDGGSARAISAHPDPDDPDFTIGADYISGIGGDGANALPPPQAINGNGGTGGNGGGAGGNEGGILGFWSNSTGYPTIELGGGDPYRGGTGFYGPAKGGKGSVGGQGGNGVAIIYW